METVAPQATDAYTFTQIEGSVIHTAASMWQAGDAFYAYRNSSGWNSINLGIAAVKGMDVDGDVVFALMGGPKLDRAEAVRIEGTSYSTEIITTLPYWLSVGELRIDSQSRVHVAMRTAGDTLHYAVRNIEGTWETAQLATDSAHVALALDSSGTPYILYDPISGGTDELRIGAPDLNGNWTFEKIHGCGGGQDFAFDSDDYLHIACSSSGRLIYMWTDASGWHSETLVPSSRSFRDVALALDANDRPHLVFRYPFNSLNPDDVARRSNLEYAFKTSGGWLFETADHDGTGNGFYPSIDIDDHGRPHVAYVMAWRSFSLSCDHPLNVCYDLRYATPAASALRLVGE